MKTMYNYIIICNNILNSETEILQRWKAYCEAYETQNQLPIADEKYEEIAIHIHIEEPTKE